MIRFLTCVLSKQFSCFLKPIPSPRWPTSYTINCRNFTSTIIPANKTLSRTISSSPRPELAIEDTTLWNETCWNENENDDSLSDIRKEFVQYKGGNVQLSQDESSGVATLVLNHPERKNAISGEMMVQFGDALSALEEWPQGKCLFIYGTNNFFCSGGDLNTVKQLNSPEGGRRMSLLMHHYFSRLSSLPMLTVALISGKALGGGAELSTACDFRIMTKEAQIGFVHIRVGIATAWGGGVRLTQLIGASKALELMASGRRVGCEEAFKIGLTDHVIEESEDDAHMLELASSWIQKFTQFPTETLRASKGIVNSAQWLPLELALRRELDYSSHVWSGSEHKKALAGNVKHRD